MEKQYLVYIHTNRANGKKYVGMTSLKPSQRFQKGNGYSHQPRFFDDIVKYGWDNFDHEVYKSGLTKEEAKLLESDLIHQLRTYYPECGYNTFKPLYDDDGNLIIDMKKYYHHRPPQYLVRCVNTDKLYSSYAEAARDTGIDKSTIGKAARGTAKSAGRDKNDNKIYWERIPNPDYKNFQRLLDRKN